MKHCGGQKYKYHKRCKGLSELKWVRDLFHLA